MRERGRWCRVGGMSLNGEGGPAVNGEDPATSSTNREHGGQSNDPNVGVETINGDAYFFDKLDLGSISAAEVWNLRFVDNEVAFEFYRRYAKRRGFGVRRNQVKRGKDGVLLWQSFACSSEGFRSAVHIGRENRQRSERRLTRCGCKAMFRVHIDKENGGWYVTGFNDQHNHETVDEESSALFRSHRIMTKEDSAQINCMREAGIPIPKIYAMLACQSGGYPLIGFNKRDMYNDIAQQRLVGSGDAETALKELRQLAHTDNSMWEKLKSDNGVEFNDWVSDLYEMKEKWATAYIRGEFYAGLTTTSRCEGLHAQVGRYVESGYTLTEFIHHFQRCLSYIRWAEVSADHVSQVGEPVLKTQLVELERFGASVYTHEIFKMFQVVLKSAESKFVLGWRELRSQVIYLVTRYRKPDSRWLVSYAREEGMMKCSCLRMESTGISCSHIVKLGASFGDDTLFSSRYGALSDICRYWCNLAARSEEDFMELRQKALIDCQRLEGKQGTEDNDADRTQRQGEQHVNVRDPIRVRTKGRVKNTPSRAPIKRPFKCGFCRGEGHSRNHCPMKDHSQHSSYPGYTQHDLEVPCSMGIDAVMKDQKWN
ncbi:hypothetical protein RIF29_31506 [Crotalaria pallida]|uniref:SWIM-type domain-containing protein n=1 Tax=Crotalaria pallida TaxID=3830 RepID=A0AAN9EHP7_CROPI